MYSRAVGGESWSIPSCSILARQATSSRRLSVLAIARSSGNAKSEERWFPAPRREEEVEMEKQEFEMTEALARAVREVGVA
ncbi:hypothetical protein LCGC14_1401040 [marine sediment metagenome]|uniref:Uncharacterized protein n=1 Tax=marine sediment metagenome TaxID=412755 RepID=A0A0F9MCN3_9ZZZZ